MAKIAKRATGRKKVAAPVRRDHGADAVAFLDAFFDADDPIFVCSFANTRDQTKTYPARDVVVGHDRQEAASFLKEYDVPGRSTYFAVNVMNGDVRKKTEVAKITALHIDIDLKGVIEDRKTIEATLRKLKCAPTFTVMSGNGYHVYWLLKTPLGPANIPSHEKMLERLCAVLAGDKSAAEVSRVLRLPGSRNSKDPDNIKLVALMKGRTLSSGKRYTVDELDAWIEESDRLLTYKPPPQKLNGTCNGAQHHNAYQAFDDEIERPIVIDDALDAMEYGGQHRNGIDDTYCSVVGAMIKRGSTVQECIDVLIDRSREVYERDKKANEPIWSDTIAIASIKEKFKRFKKQDEERRAKEAKDDEADEVAEPKKVNSVGAPGIIVQRADQITMRRKQWLWPGRLLRGGQEMLSGQPGLGKSQLQIDLMSRASRGAMWPDGAPGGDPVSVIMLTAEDALDQEVVPRLHAANADLGRIHIVRAIRKDKKERQFLLGEDLEKLKALVSDIGDVGLMAIDPITSYMGKIDSHSNTDVRSQLGPLKDFAEVTNIAISTITHPPKGGGQRAIDSFIGSQAFIAACRIGHLCIEEFEYDEETREKTATGRILFCDVKNNAARKGSTLAYRIEEADVPGSNAYDLITAPRVVWEKDAVDVTADGALGHGESGGSRKSETQNEVKRFLRDMLKTGEPVAQKEIEEQATALGFSAKQLRTAREALGISASKSAFGGGWEWKMRAQPKPLPTPRKSGSAQT